MKTVDNLDLLTDGHEYAIGDMVKADPSGCENCHACCTGVSDYVSLSPYDIYQLLKDTKLSLAELCKEHVVFTVDQKLSQPHLKTVGEDNRCSFLNDAGRCSVHGARPDICRLFPLARVYDSDDFHYTLQLQACVKPKLDKVKVKRHLGVDHYNTYKGYIWSWYQVNKALAFRMKFARESEAVEAINLSFWNSFYNNPVLMSQEDPVAFIEMYFELLPDIKQQLGIL